MNPVSGKPKRKAFRIIGIGLLILLLIGGGAALWVSRNYKRIILEKLPAMSAKATDSIYLAGAEDVRIDLPGRTVVLINLTLDPDRLHLAKLAQELNLPRVLFKATIPELRIEGISWAALLKDNELICDAIIVTKPMLRITKLSKDAPEPKEDKPSRIKAIKAGQILVTDPDIAFTDETGKDPVSYAGKGGRLLLRDLDYRLDGANDSTRLFYARSTLLRLNSFSINNPKDIYKISCGAIDFSDSAHSLGIAGIDIHPAISKEEFYRRTGKQKEIYEVRFPQLSLRGLDWYSLLHRGSLFADGGSLNGGNIKIYMSRVPPPNLESKNGKFPHQLLAKLKLPLNIKTLAISDGQFAYTEKNYKTMQEGTVAMNGISGAITNITNVPAAMRTNSHCTISMKGLFKGSPIKAIFGFTLGSKAGAFTVEGEQAAFDGTKLNDIIRPLALAELSSMKLNKVLFRFRGDEAGAQGKMTFLYEDMKAKLLEMEDGGLDKKSVTSFLANALLVYPANPMPGKDVRDVDVSVKRDPTKSFFNLIWKSIFTGSLQTASRIVRLDKMVDKRAKKQEAKRKKELAK